MTTSMTSRLFGWLPGMGGMSSGGKQARDVLPVRLSKSILS